MKRNQIQDQILLAKNPNYSLTCSFCFAPLALIKLDFDDVIGCGVASRFPGNGSSSRQKKKADRDDSLHLSKFVNFLKIEKMN